MTEVKWLISKKIIIFQGSGGGPTFSRGSNFFQGGGSNCLFPIETHIPCDFPGESKPPVPPPPPLDPHLGIINSLYAGKCFCQLHCSTVLGFVFIFKINFVQKSFMIPPECQFETIWIQIRPDILSDLIWVQTVCKGYQMKMLAIKEKKDVSDGFFGTFYC